MSTHPELWCPSTKVTSQHSATGCCTWSRQWHVMSASRDRSMGTAPVMPCLVISTSGEFPGFIPDYFLFFLPVYLTLLWSDYLCTDFSLTPIFYQFMDMMLYAVTNPDPLWPRLWSSPLHASVYWALSWGPQTGYSTIKALTSLWGLKGLLSLTKLIGEGLTGRTPAHQLIEGARTLMLIWTGQRSWTLYPC